MKNSQRTMRQRTHGVNSVYPSNWPVIAKATKEAADMRCVRCRHPHEGAWKVSGLDPMPCDSICQHDQDGKQRILTTHHLDMNKANVDWWNLAALCQVCHLSIQARVDWHQYFMMEHSDWMLPYLKGWTIWQITGITVVNVGHAPFTRYIGRPNARLKRKHPTMELANPWMNPYRITTKRDRAHSIAEYRGYIEERIAEEPATYDLASLIGHTIGCWCKPKACHGDVLAELVVGMVIATNGGRYGQFEAILSA